MKRNIIALLILSCFLVAQDKMTVFFLSTQPEDDSPIPGGAFEDIDSSKYYFKYKNGKKTGEIVLSADYTKFVKVVLGKQSNSTSDISAYKFQDKYKEGKVLGKNDYKVLRSSDNLGGLGILWYDYHLYVYSEYPNGQLKEEGNFEKRLGRKPEGFRPVAGLTKAVVGVALSPLTVTANIFTGGQSKAFQKLYKKNDYLLKDGLWSAWYPNGDLKFEGHYSNGKRSGKWNEYYENGQKKSEGTYSRTVYDDGRVIVSGFKTDEWNEYYKDGKKKSEGHYSNGKRSGKWNEYYENGQKKSEGIYAYDGTKDGQWNEYYENGQKKYGGVFKGDTKKGKHAEWYASGWIKEYSVDGVVTRSHKESEQAFLWNSRNDKNYKTADALATDLYLEEINSHPTIEGKGNNSIVKGIESSSLKFESKSNPVPSQKMYQTFVFIGEYVTFTGKKRYYVNNNEVERKARDFYFATGEYATNATISNFQSSSTYCCRTVRSDEKKHKVKYTFNCKDGKCTKD